MQHILNIDDQPLHVQHLGYFVEDSGYGDNTYVCLVEVRLITYRHPEVPDHSAIQRIEQAIVIREKKGSVAAAPMEMLRNSQQTVRSIFRDTKPECGLISVDAHYDSLRKSGDRS